MESEINIYLTADFRRQTQTGSSKEQGTTGDVFVQKNFPNSRTIALSKSGDAPTELKRRSTDIFVYDGPAIMWLVSQNEANFLAIKKPLNEEFLACGVRRDDEALLATVNKILAD